MLPPVIAITNYKGRPGEAVKFRLSPARWRGAGGSSIGAFARDYGRKYCDFIQPRVKCVVARCLLCRRFPFEDSSSFFSLIGNVNWCVPGANDWLDSRGLSFHRCPEDIV